MTYDLYIFHHVEYELLFSYQNACCKTQSSMIMVFFDLILLNHLISVELYQPCTGLNIVGLSHMSTFLRTVNLFCLVLLSMYDIERFLENKTKEVGHTCTGRYPLAEEIKDCGFVWQGNNPAPDYYHKV